MSIGALCYLKLIGGDIVYILGGSCTYPGPRPGLLALNQALQVGSNVTCIIR